MATKVAQKKKRGLTSARTRPAGTEAADIREELAVATGGLSLRLAAGVRKRRLERGLTQEEAARASHLPEAYWQRLEGGECNATLRTLRRLAFGLGVDPVELFAPPLRESSR